MRKFTKEISLLLAAAAAGTTAYASLVSAAPEPAEAVDGLMAVSDEIYDDTPTAGVPMATDDQIETATEEEFPPTAGEPMPTDEFIETTTEEIVPLAGDIAMADGDINGDGYFGISDVVTLQKWLLAVPDIHLVDWWAADFNYDGRLDVFDLCLMKEELRHINIVQPKTELQAQFPEYYGLSATKGLEVYVWKDRTGVYKCGLTSGTNWNKSYPQILGLTNNGAAIEQMKEILASYNISQDMIIIMPIQFSGNSWEISESDMESVTKLFWGDSSDELIFKQLSAGDIDNVTLSAYPPGKSVELTKDQIDKMLSLLGDVTLYEEDNSYNEYGGHWVQFDITLKNGEQLSLAVFNPFFIINRSGYRAEYESCQALDVFANSIIAE